jgi:hypothetical protein
VLAEEQYQAKDYYTAKDTAEEALASYSFGKTWLDAYNVRAEIADRNFDVYDPMSVELADDVLFDAADNYLAKDYSGAGDKAEEALLRFNLALRAGWECYAAEMGAFAAAERQNALDLKANVAVRQEFNTAQAVYARADTAFQAERFEEAVTLYDDSLSQFEVITLVAKEKQLVAERALVRANEKIEESDETARAAEVVLEGGGR